MKATEVRTESQRLDALAELTGVEKALAVCTAWQEQDENGLQVLFGEDHEGWWDHACRDYLIAEYRELAGGKK